MPTTFCKLSVFAAVWFAMLASVAAQESTGVEQAGFQAPVSSSPTGGATLKPQQGPSLDLPAPGQSADNTAQGSSMVPAWGSVIAALLVVLGLFFLFAWLLRRAVPQGSGALPSEVLEVLGRAPLASRQSVHLLKIGHKLLLVSVTASGTAALCEITDGEEVDRLLGLCQQNKSNSSTKAFRAVLGQFTRDSRSKGELEPAPVVESASPDHGGAHA